MHLIVKQPFGGYAKGDVITDDNMGTEWEQRR